MAGLMLAAALSVALIGSEPVTLQETNSNITGHVYSTVISASNQAEKKEKPIRKAIINKENNETKEAINHQAIIKMTGLDPLTVKTLLTECKKNSMDPFLILGLLKSESSFNPKATSRKGARGLGQLMTPVGRWTAKREGLSFSSRSLYNPTYNVKLTVNYFSYLYKAFKGNAHKALTSYNRGIRGMQYYERRNKTTVSSYSKKVLKNQLLLKKQYEKLTKVNKSK